MTIIPPYLKPADQIAVVCPSGYMPLEKTLMATQALSEWGFTVLPGKTLGNRFHYFGGTDEDRLADLQQMMDDKNVKAIFCARGGYGMSRIIEGLSFKKFRKHPKWIVGFSDITVLQSHLYARYKIASLHAPMAGAFNDEAPGNEFIQSLHHALVGLKADYLAASHDFNRIGEVTGTLIGGNLSLLTHLVGTGSEMDFDHKILFIEDVGEYIYNVDRMMIQLKRNAKLKKLKGLIVGKFTEMKDTTLPFGQQAEEVIRDLVAEYDYPVCFNFPVSHSRENYALKIGCKFHLSISPEAVTLQEV